MGVEAFVVVGVIIGVLLLLSLTRIAADAILLTGLTLLMIVPVPVKDGWGLGVLSPAEGLAGFSNPALVTVGALYVVVCGLRDTGAISWVAGRFLRPRRTLRGALANIFIPTCGVSAFLNNTPVVAMLIPAVTEWAPRIKQAPSRLLIPLSYASILGGTCSLIGTSTNLVVAGLVIAETDLPPLRMFDITLVGLPCALIGGAFLLLVGPYLLPDRRPAAVSLADPREYMLEMFIPERSGLNGKTVEGAGLRGLPGCYLVDIERGDQIIHSVDPSQVLRTGDRLRFVGVVEAIRDVQRLRGLVPATDQVFKLDSPRHRRRLFEVVVSDRSPVVGKSIRAGRFRNRYNAAVMAVARGSERLAGRIGDIELRAGDTLLIEAHQTFADQYRDSRDFLLVSGLADSAPQQTARAPIAVSILLLMVVAATVEILPMVTAALTAAILMIVTRCCTITDARRGVDWSVLIVIGAALGIGHALEESGATRTVAEMATSIAGDHPWLLLIAVYAATSLLTEIVTNNAAVAMMFPLVHVTVEQTPYDFMPFAIAMMMAGSASFATPLGYQTNLMVYGPGGYNALDFLRIGVPMNLVAGITTVIVTPLVFPF